jgi:capsular exopolysaccharide synthesis family protein
MSSLYPKTANIIREHGDNLKYLELANLPALDYACSEGMNTLCANLAFAGKNVKSILVTSCHAGEGKTFLALNLARALAGTGKNVILVDGDMRRSKFQSTYGRSVDKPPQGLAHYLAELCEWEEAVCQTNIDGLYMIGHGRSVANPFALLTSPRLPQLIAQLERSFELAIFDSPPVGLVVDAAEIAKSCKGVLLTVTSGQIAKKEMTDAVKQIELTGTPILGFVMNKVTFDTHSAKKHYYKAYYSHYQSGYYDKDTSGERR